MAASSRRVAAFGDRPHDPQQPDGKAWRDCLDGDAGSHRQEEQHQQRLGHRPRIDRQARNDDRHGERHQQDRADGGDQHEGGGIGQVPARAPHHHRQERRSGRQADQQQAGGVGLSDRQQPRDQPGKGGAEQPVEQRGGHDEAQIAERCEGGLEVGLQADRQQVADHEGNDGHLEHGPGDLQDVAHAIGCFPARPPAAAQASRAASMRPWRIALTNARWSRCAWSAYSTANSAMASSKVSLAPM